jgi:DNA-binding NarL/FixJ family response regulator
MDMQHDLTLLSSRQKEILGLMASGQPVDTISRRLSLTDRTIWGHQQLMIRLFELNDETALIQLAKSIYL